MSPILTPRRIKLRLVICSASMNRVLTAQRFRGTERKRPDSMRRAMTALALPLSLPFSKPNPSFKLRLLLPPLPSRSPLSSTRPSPPRFRELSSSSATLLSSPSPSLSSPPLKDGAGFGLEPYLSCSMPGRHLRVAVLLSGGVDSSVALRLLHAAGHECTAFYLKIWFQVLFLPF
jgi:tRNA methyl transferase